jgi:hypothetical protein
MIHYASVNITEKTVLKMKRLVASVETVFYFGIDYGRLHVLRLIIDQVNKESPLDFVSGLFRNKFIFYIPFSNKILKCISQALHQNNFLDKLNLGRVAET